MSTILISGATGNLGSAVITEFSRNDFKIIALYHKNVPTSGQNVISVQANLREEEEAASTIEKILEENDIDIAVLTAGGFAGNSISKTGINDIRQMISLNFETAYAVVKPLFEQMLNRNKGMIFLIGSEQGLHPQKGTNVVAYTLSKSLLFALAKILNAEAKGKNVSVEVMVPSIIDTPQNRAAMPQADTDSWMKPEKIAEEIYRKVSGAAGSY